MLKKHYRQHVEIALRKRTTRVERNRKLRKPNENDSKKEGKDIRIHILVVNM